MFAHRCRKWGVKLCLPHEHLPLSANVNTQVSKNKSRDACQGHIWTVLCSAQAALVTVAGDLSKVNKRLDLRAGRQVPPPSPWQVSHENHIRVMINKGRMAPLFLGGDRGLLIWVNTDTDVTGKGARHGASQVQQVDPTELPPCKFKDVYVRFKIC